MLEKIKQLKWKEVEIASILLTEKLPKNRANYLNEFVSLLFFLFSIFFFVEVQVTGIPKRNKREKDEREYEKKKTMDRYSVTPEPDVPEGLNGRDKSSKMEKLSTANEEARRTHLITLLSSLTLNPLSLSLSLSIFLLFFFFPRQPTPGLFFFIIHHLLVVLTGAHRS